MSGNKRVLIIVDHPTRDLRGVLLMGVELARRGVEVILTPHNISSFEVWKHRADLVVLNYLRSNNEPLVSNLIEAGIEFAVLDTEGGIFENYEVFKKSLTKKADILRECAAYMVWGTKIKRILTESGILNEAQVVLTGQPRMDFYHSSFSKALSNLHKESKGHSDFILVNGTFSFSRPRFSTPEKEFEQVVNLFGLTQDYALRMLNYEKEIYPKLMDLICSLAEDFPNKKIIYRPHPFENPEEANNRLKGLKSVEINNEGSVDGWIAKSAALIQLNCSTAFEGNFLGVPVLLPIFLGEPFGDPRITAISHLVRSYEEMKELLSDLQHYQRPKGVASDWDKYLEEIYYANDGKSFLRCADTVEEILTNSKKIPNSRIINNISKRPDVSDSNPLKRAIKTFVASMGLAGHFKFGNIDFLEQKAVKKWQLSSKYFDKDLVDYFVTHLKETNPSWKKVRVLTPKIIPPAESFSILLSSTVD